MRSLFHSVTRLLLLVMLTTVFSPSFGWQVAQGMVTRAGGPDMPASIDEHTAHGRHADQSHDSRVSDSVGHESELCADTRHHCCPGYIIGQLLGGTGAHVVILVVAGSLAAPVGRDVRFSSRVPDGLERPPRDFAA